MFKTLTAGLVAVSLTLGSVAPTTAQAEITNEEALVGLFTLLLLGAAINNNQEDERRDRTPAGPRGDRWKVLPSTCLRDIETRRGETVRLFTSGCLSRNYAHANRLPDRCEITVRNDRGVRHDGYVPRCLRDAGFRRDDRH